MKIQLDTTNKQITLQDSVKLSDLIKELKAILPNDLWKEYTLNTNVTITWSNPITIYHPYNYYPYSPLEPYKKLPWITYTSGNSYNINDGIYNIDSNIIN